MIKMIEIIVKNGENFKKNILYQSTIFQLLDNTSSIFFFLINFEKTISVMKLNITVDAPTIPPITINIRYDINKLIVKSEKICLFE